MVKSSLKILFVTIIFLNLEAIAFDKIAGKSLHVKAQAVEITPDENKAELKGKVVIEEQGSVINADHATIYYNRTQEGDFSLQSIEGKGNITFSHEEEKAQGKSFNYDAKKGEMVLEGNVMLAKGHNTLYTDKYTYNVLRKAGTVGADSSKGNRTKMILGDVKNLK